jgi:hypothetical protein
MEPGARHGRGQPVRERDHGSDQGKDKPGEKDVQCDCEGHFVSLSAAI